jgi:hypothetical protein
MTLLVKSSLRHPPLPFCIILPKEEMKFENPSQRPFLTFHVFAQLWQHVPVRQGMRCSCLTSSCKYALFSFSKRKLKYQTVKKLTYRLLTYSGPSWHTESTSRTLRVPTCPVATSLCFIDCIILKHNGSLQFSPWSRRQIWPSCRFLYNKFCQLRTMY